MAIKRLCLAFAALLSLFAFSLASDKIEFIKVEDVQPGMKGIGKTCFKGTHPEEFQVEVLGVLHGMNPGARAVLAKFSGALIDKTGIFEGMSGSPVYIDGKLLGAVAFTYPYAKEAIGGITPITDMVQAFSQKLELSPAGSAGLSKSDIEKIHLSSLGKLKIEESGFIKQKSVNAGAGIRELIPISTPLHLGGFETKTLEMFAPQFKALGMTVLQGVGGSGAKTAKKGLTSAAGLAIEPGSNIVVPLVRGDLDVSAGGTVTYVDGNRLYAFGHNMFNLGFTNLPMHMANAITVFPSLESSFKILEIGEAVGSIRQDRSMGIFGVLGENPKMAPLEVHLTTSRGGKRDFRYELASDPLLTPILVNLAVYNSIAVSERGQGIVTFSVKGTIAIKGEQPVIVDSRFSSDSDASSSAALSIAVPVNYLMNAGYKNLDLESITVEIAAQENDQAAELDSIRFSRNEVKAGENLDLEVSYRKANGEITQDTYPIPIPENVSPGVLSMLVADGSTIMAVDDSEEGEKLIPRDLTQLIRLLNNQRKNDCFYVRFYRQAPGALVKGEGLPGLPPSIMSILKSDRKSGALTPIRTSTLMEYELPRTELVVSGAKVLKLVVKP